MLTFDLRVYLSMQFRRRMPGSRAVGLVEVLSSAIAAAEYAADQGPHRDGQEPLTSVNVIGSLAGLQTATTYGVTSPVCTQSSSRTASATYGQLMPAHVVNLIESHAQAAYFLAIRTSTATKSDRGAMCALLNNVFATYRCAAHHHT